ncbi:hypothetical protein [Natranaerobius thermophilus]|uniref:Uncharacterized protein n=1 Tax=Natranaerobius thermophilus (strain ATCC BAA-1301 / DSM 18059 / JW/NM-WN-LF) TaxID=457570 RepID=B2A715_NATTJ|nr:hypothetical protein [Natranaerobius thermophilus]ACB85606.1 hypothetical protein Nther_2039 [Natranaerobius thermophilus JW/NM-WN-LF]
MNTTTNQDQLQNVKSSLSQQSWNMSSFSDTLLNDFHYVISEIQQLRNQLQTVRDEELELKNNLSGVLSNFEEKAGQGNGLNGLLRNNSQLKHDIMQKRSSIDRKCLNLMEKTNNLFQTVDQISSTLQEQSERHARNTAALEFELSRIQQELAQIESPMTAEPNLPSSENPELNQPLENLLKETMNTIQQLNQSTQQASQQ